MDQLVIMIHPVLIHLMNMVVTHPVPDLLEAVEVVDAAAVIVAVEVAEDAAVVIAVEEAVAADVEVDMVVETKEDTVVMAATEA